MGKRASSVRTISFPEKELNKKSELKEQWNQHMDDLEWPRSIACTNSFSCDLGTVELFARGDNIKIQEPVQAIAVLHKLRVAVPLGTSLDHVQKAQTSSTHTCTT